MPQSIQQVVAELVAERDRMQKDPDLAASDYWRDFCGYFRYVFSLPQDELVHIRRHTYHLTSDLYQRYYFATPEYRDLLIRGHRFFLDQLDGFVLDEGAAGIGVVGPTGRVSHDLLRYLGTLVDLVQCGVLERSGATRIMEIGGGYGGLARSVLEYHPSASYVICDLEETLVFSGLYLSQMIGGERVHVERGPFSPRPGHVHLVAQSRPGDYDDLHFDFVINQQSMQEMSASQVRRYCGFIAAHAESFYVCNLEGHVPDLAEEKNIVTGLSSILEDYFPNRVWNSTPPAEHERFGDNILRRQLFRVGQGAGSLS